MSLKDKIITITNGMFNNAETTEDEINLHNNHWVLTYNSFGETVKELKGRKGKKQQRILQNISVSQITLYGQRVYVLADKDFEEVLGKQEGVKGK